MTERLDPEDDTTLPMARLDAPDGRGHVAYVNLLPSEIGRERRRQRMAVISFGVLAVYLIGLCALYIAKSNEVAQAQAERDTAQQRVAVLQAEVDELAEYQTLVDDINARQVLLTTAMDEELSWARIFGDLALAFSRDASLTQVEAIATPDEPLDGEIVAPAAPDTGATEPAASEPATPEPADPELAPDAEAEDRTAVAQVTFTGYSVEELSPGVAEVLSNFAEADGFFDSWLTTAIEEERGDSLVTSFEGRVELNDQAYTRRYSDGLPEESLE